MANKIVGAGIAILLIIGLICAGSAEAAWKSRYGNYKNVIIMIGDGMGPNHVEYGRWIEYGRHVEPPAAGLSMETLPYSYASKIRTYSADNAVTDSAAGATAYSCGQKTANARIAMTADLKNPQSMKTILENAQEMGKATGLVTTTDLTDATPASFASHSPHRDNKTIITAGMSKSKVDIMLGGGRATFSQDQIMHTMVHELGYTLVENRDQLFQALDFENDTKWSPSSCDKQNAMRVLGLFAPENLPWELVRDYDAVPSLSEMASKALEFLSRKVDCSPMPSGTAPGFFLMIEGGNIDKAAHINNSTLNPLETIEFSNAIQVVKDFINSRADPSDTLLIVTADHETGGLVIEADEDFDSLPLPSAVGSSMTAIQKRDLRALRTESVNATFLAGYNHTAANVGLYSNQPELINAYLRKKYPQKNNEKELLIENTDVFYMMKEFLEQGNTTTSMSSVSVFIIVLGAISAVAVMFAAHFKELADEKRRTASQLLHNRET